MRNIKNVARAKHKKKTAATSDGFIAKLPTVTFCATYAHRWANYPKPLFSFMVREDKA